MSKIFQRFSFLYDANDSHRVQMLALRFDAFFMKCVHLIPVLDEEYTNIYTDTVYSKGCAQINAFKHITYNLLITMKKANEYICKRHDLFTS